MNGEFVLDSLEFIDADLIEEAGRAEPRKRKRWALPIAAAACLCLIVGAAWFLRGREAKEPGVQKWSPSLSAQDYFKDCGGDRGPGLSASDSIAMPPYAAELSLDGERRELEEAGALPPLPDHPAQHFWAYYNGNGSLYKLSFWWMERPEDETGGYSDLRLTAAPKELHEVSDEIVITKDEAGNVIPPRVTVTERDGIRIVAEGGEHEAKTLTWQRSEVWYQLYASGTDGEARIVALLDWFWAHPLSLDRFREMAGECFTYATRAEEPEAFRKQIPDFEALGYEAAEELVNLVQVYKAPNKGDLVPVWFEGVYTRGETRVSWTVSTGADADAWEACLGRAGEITGDRLREALSEGGEVNIFFDLPCMATLRLEQGSAADAWEIVHSLAG